MKNSGVLRVAWITGAGKGIGRAVAKRLATDGWSVAVSARTESDLNSLRAACPIDRIFVYPLDVTDPAATQKTIDRIERDLGPLNLAVLNAGTHKAMLADKLSAKTFRELLEVNLMGTVNGLEVLLPRFISRRNGHVAIVASVAGYCGLPSAAAYGASKAALINMCEALKPDLDRHGVRLSLINPGFVETPLTDQNDFAMPFLMHVDDAAESIVRGLRGGAFEIAFPWTFAMLMKFLRLMPYSLFFLLTRRMVQK